MWLQLLSPRGRLRTIALVWLPLSVDGCKQWFLEHRWCASLFNGYILVNVAKYWCVPFELFLVHPNA